jgi:hypothetical protein
MRTIAMAAALLLLASCVSAIAAVPQTLSYQGVLRDGTAGIVPDGEYDITFWIYNMESGGIALWAETQTVTVADGILNAVIGSVATLDLPFDEQYWLGISVDGGPVLSPRTELTSVPYAARAAYADVADDGDWIVGGDDAYRAGGFVGIGTTSPVYSLDIQRNENATAGIRIKNTDTGGLSTEMILFSNEDGDVAGIVLNDDDSTYANAMSIMNNRPSGSIRLRTGGLERLRVSSDGSVGIGVSLPERLLHVGGTARVEGFEMTPGAGDGYVLTSDALGVGTWQQPAAVSDNDWTISGNNMSSGVSGYVGVGTSTPQDKLEVKGVLRLDSGAGNSNILRFVDGGTMKWALLYRPWVDGNLTVLDEVSLVRSMTFESGTGDVGIKTEHPETDLHVVGDVRVDGNLQVNGEITRSAATGYYTVGSGDFTPSYPEDTDYVIGGGVFTTGASAVLFLAPVHLPHGATVTSVTHKYIDNSVAEDSQCALSRRTMSGYTEVDMATVWSTGSSGSGSTTDTTIDYAVIDNTSYSYYVVLRAIDGIITYGVVIEYTTTGVN